MVHSSSEYFALCESAAAAVLPSFGPFGLLVRVTGLIRFRVRVVGLEDPTGHVNRPGDGRVWRAKRARYHMINPMFDRSMHGGNCIASSHILYIGTFHFRYDIQYYWLKFVVSQKERENAENGVTPE